MRVLHVIPNLLKGGAQRIAIDICRELTHRKEVSVKLVYFEGENEFEFLTNQIDIEKIKIDFKLSFSRKHQIDLKSYEHLINEFAPDIIHSHLYLAELVSRENPRKNIKYITHCHDNMRQLKVRSLLLIKQNLVEYLERNRLLKKYKQCENIFIAISQHGVHFLKNNLPLELQPSVILMHNSIDLKSFQNKKSDSYHKYSLINVGNFIHKKNQLFLIDVLYKLKSRYKDINLTFLGDGATRTQVENRVHDLNLEENVSFKGKTDNVADELNMSSIYVHSAFYEPFGLVLIEAMAAGLPVVSMDGLGNRDLIKDGENGFLINQGDLDRFVQCILNLMNDPFLFKKIKEAGYKTANQYDIPPYVDRLLSIYSSKKH